MRVGLHITLAVFYIRIKAIVMRITLQFILVRIFAFSMVDIAEAFKKLLQDKKNGAVMTVSKEKDAAAKFVYVKQQWNQIE